MAGAATRLAIFLVGYSLGSPGASFWLPSRSGHDMLIIITSFDYTSAGPPPGRLIGTGPSDRRPFRCSGPALSGHLRRPRAADPRRAGALDPQESCLTLATGISCFCFELGTTVGLSTAFLAIVVAGKRLIIGALPRQTWRSGFLGWPPAALASAFRFSCFGLSHDKPATNHAPNAANLQRKGAENLATDDLLNRRRRFKCPHEDLANGNAPYQNTSAPKAWPPNSWKANCGVLRLRTTLWPTSSSSTALTTSWPPTSQRKPLGEEKKKKRKRRPGHGLGSC